MSDESKFEREIVARGITTSNTGSEIRVNDATYRIEGVKYNGDTTLVKVNTWLVLPNDMKVTIID